MKHKKSFSPSLSYHLENTHPVKKASLQFDSGAYSYTDISALIVALQDIQQLYSDKFGLDKL